MSVYLRNIVSFDKNKEFCINLCGHTLFVMWKYNKRKPRLVKWKIVCS